MELMIFILSVIIGLTGYVYFQRRTPLQDSGRDYYYKRFTRNKEQLKKYIADLEKIINNSPESKLVLGVDVEIKVVDYLKSIKEYFEKEFPEKDLKRIKRKKLTYKEKNIFTKKLNEQSEKLYKIEMEINSIILKDNNVNYTLV